MKSKEKLKSFTEYCKKNPDLRFWQALRNWSGYNFIYGSKKSVLDPDLIDTYYKH